MPNTSAAQIQANRENARHSTGPVTEEGKAAASLNRFEHGFCGAFRILNHEDVKTWDALRLALREEHQPATPTESILVERLARHHWLSQRAQFLQSSLFFARHLTCDEQKYLALYLRYQTTNDRAFSKCLNELAALRAEKRKEEIGFERERRTAAEYVRKQEAHQARARLSVVRAHDLELSFTIRQRLEAQAREAQQTADAQENALSHAAGQNSVEEMEANTSGLINKLKAA